MQDIRSKRHVVYNLHLHLVFVTKYRKKVFSELMIERLKYHFLRVCKDFDCRLIDANGEKNHHTLETCEQPERCFIEIDA